MKMSIWYRANRVFQEVVFRIAPWTVIFYAKREYGYSLRSLWAVWRVSKAEDRPLFSDSRFPHTRTVDFFSRVAGRAHDDSEIYQCVNGCCTVIWHPKRGNTGGMGPAGCSCDDLQDPRDLVRGMIRKGL